MSTGLKHCCGFCSTEYRGRVAQMGKEHIEILPGRKEQQINIEERCLQQEQCGS